MHGCTRPADDQQYRRAKPPTLSVFASPKAISARAVLMSRVFTRTWGKISPHKQPVKIPDIRIELRSKWIPGKREDELLLVANGQRTSSLVSLV
jgi:hypothetical protein